MLNRLLGKSNAGEDAARSQGSRRKHSRRSSVSTAKSLDGRDKEKDREDRRHEDGEYTRSRKERNTEERSRSRDRGDVKRERRTKRDKKDKDPTDRERLDRSMDGYDEGTARGPTGGHGGFSEQIGSSGFAQFPGQYNPSGFVGGPSAPSAGLSDRIPDQFPGQFPLNSAAPYRPPASANQAGVGLAAEYYGDSGQFVAQQPGVRPQLPPVGAPPTQTTAATPFFGATSSEINQVSLSNISTTNNVSSAYQQSNIPDPVTIYPHDSNKPDKKYHSSSTPVVASLGAAAAGAAIGYTMSNHSHQHESGITSNFGESGPSEFASSAYQRPTHSHEYHNSASASFETSKPTKYSQQQSHLPLYAAGAVGAAGLAASASHNDYNHSAPQYQTSQMAQRHRHHGPLSLLVDFFKDPDGVAKFEEYTEYIGVCKGCFAPDSSPRDAPRKHHYRYRSPKDRRNGGSRVDKDSRYWSSDGESQKKNKSSWLTTAIAGYGIAKIGEKVFNQAFGPDDNYTVNSGRGQKSQSSASGRRSTFSPDRRDYNSRIPTSGFSASQRKSSVERAETRFVSNSKEYKKEKTSQVSGGSSMAIYGSPPRSRLRSRSRSKSRDRKGGLLQDIIGVGMVASALSTKSRRRSRSPRVAFAKSKHRSRGDSPGRTPNSSQRKYAYDQQSRRSPTKRSDRHASKKKKAGFFNFSVESSSSTEEFSRSDDSSERKRAYKAKVKEQGKTDAALAIAGAAILASNERRQEDKPTRGGELVAVKESKPSQARKPRSDAKTKSEIALSGLEEIRRSSFSEDEYVSADSSLAYGRADGTRRRGSRESFSSDSSDMSKWGWRWGGMQSSDQNGRKKTYTSGGHSQQTAAPITGILKGGAGSTGEKTSTSYIRNTSSEVPLQHVYPLSTSDQYQFDVALQGSAGLSRQPKTSSRPAAIPIQHHQTQAPSIQHPQPIAPLPTTVYDSQPLYVHSYSDPTGHQVLSETQHQSQYPVSFGQPENFARLQYITTADSHSERHEANAPSFDQRTSNLRRSNTSPTLSSTHPLSDQNVPSAAGFEVGAERLELDRRENRRRKRESQDFQSTHQRHETDDFDPNVKGDEISKAEASKLPFSEMSRQKIFRDEDVVLPTAIESKPPEVSLWTAPAAIGGIGALVSRIAKSGNSDPISAHEPQNDQKANNPLEGTFITEARQTSPEPIEEPVVGVVGEVGSGEEKPVSFWQAAAQISRRTSSHEDYGAFFAPPELQSNIENRRQAASNDAGDPSSSGAPEIITIEPKGFHESSHSPAYSFSYSGDEGDMSPPPWVPKLKLIAPTPILSRSGSMDRSITPMKQLDEAANHSESRQSTTASKVTWGEHETIEYTVITPMDQPDQFIDSASQNRADNSDMAKDRDKERKADSPPPNDLTGSHRPDPDYGDDVEFADYLAAGLEKSGFDPSIVIDDPSYRQHESPARSENSRRDLESASSAENGPKFHPRTQPPYSSDSDLPVEHSGSMSMPGAFDDETPVEENDKKRELRDTRFELKNPPEVLPMKYDHQDYDESNNVSHGRSVPKIDLDQPLENTTPASAILSPTNDVHKSEVLPEADINGRRQAISGIPGTTGELAKTDDKILQYPQVSGASLIRDSEQAGPGSSPRANFESDEPLDGLPSEPIDHYESPLEDVPYSVIATSRSKGDSNKSSKKKSKRRGLGFADVISMASSSGASVKDGDLIANARSNKGEALAFESISAEKSPEPSQANAAGVEATVDDFDEPKKKSKKSKDRKSSRNDGKGGKTKLDEVATPDPQDEDEGISRVSESGKSRRSRQSTGDSTSKDSGRITQNIPAEVRPLASTGHELPENLLTDPKAEEAGTSANLSKRRTGDDGPETLDMKTEEEVHNISPFSDSPQEPLSLNKSFETVNLGQIDTNDPVASSSNNFTQVLPHELVLSNTEGQEDPQNLHSTKPVSSFPTTDNPGFKSLELAGKHVANLESAIPSSTAVPLKFRLPPPSPGSARSLSSAPQFSSSRDVPITPPNQKSRPRSTEFKSSTEYRPLWLLETHSPRKEPQVEETYPSLPSSHSSSRSSSVHDHREYGDNLATENNDLDPISSPLIIDTSKGVYQPDLLDSQQVTLTAPSYQRGAEEEVNLGSSNDAKPEKEESLLSQDRSGPSSLHPFLPSIAPSYQKGVEEEVSLGSHNDAKSEKGESVSLQDRSESLDLFPVLPSITRGDDQQVSDPQPDPLSDQYEALPALPSSRASSRDAYRESFIGESRLSLEDHTLTVPEEEPKIDLSHSVTSSDHDTKRFEFNPEPGGPIDPGEPVNIDKDANQVAKSSKLPETHKTLEPFRAPETPKALEPSRTPEVQGLPRHLDIFSVEDDENAGDDTEQIGKDSALMQALDPPSVIAAASRDEGVKMLTAHEQRLIREQDAQDAVDSWSSAPKISRRDKKDKKKRQKGASSGSQKVLKASPETAIETVDDITSSDKVIKVDGPDEEDHAKAPEISSSGSKSAQTTKDLEAGSLSTDVTRDEVATVPEDGADEPFKDEVVDPGPLPPVPQSSSSMGKRSKKSKGKKIKGPQAKIGMKIQEEPKPGEPITSSQQETTSVQMEPKISPIQSEHVESRVSSTLEEIPDAQSHESPEALKAIQVSPLDDIQIGKNESEGLHTNLQEQFNDSEDPNLTPKSSRHISLKNERGEFVSEIDGDRSPLANITDEQDGKETFVPDDSLERDGRIFYDDHLVKIDVKHDDLHFPNEPSVLVADLPKTESKNEIPMNNLSAKTDMRPDFENIELPKNENPDSMASSPDDLDLDLVESLSDANDRDISKPVTGDNDYDQPKSLPDDDDLDLLEPLPADDDLDLLEPLPKDDDLNLLEPLPQGDDPDLLESPPYSENHDLFETLSESEAPNLLRTFSGPNGLDLSDEGNSEDSPALLAPVPQEDEIGLLDQPSDNHIHNLQEPSPPDEYSNLEKPSSSIDEQGVPIPLPPDDDLDIPEPSPRGDDLDVLEPVLQSNEKQTSETVSAARGLDYPTALHDSPKNEAVIFSPASISANLDVPLANRSSSASFHQFSKTNLMDTPHQSMTESSTFPEKFEITPLPANDSLEIFPALPSSPIVEVTKTPTPKDDTSAGFPIAEDRLQLSDEFSRSLVPKAMEELRNEVENTSLHNTEEIHGSKMTSGNSVDEPLAIPVTLANPNDVALSTESNVGLNEKVYNDAEARALSSDRDLDLDIALPQDSRPLSPKSMASWDQSDITALPIADESTLSPPSNFLGESLPSSHPLIDPEDVALPADDNLDLDETLDDHPQFAPRNASSQSVGAFASPAVNDSELSIAVPANLASDALAVQNTPDKRQALAAETSDPYVDPSASLDAELIAQAKFQNENEHAIFSNSRDFVTALPSNFAPPSDSFNSQNEIRFTDFPATDEFDERGPLLESFNAEPVKTENFEHEIGSRASAADESNESTALPWALDTKPPIVEAVQHNPKDIGLPADDDLDLIGSATNLQSQPISAPENFEHNVDDPELAANESDRSTALTWALDAKPLFVEATEHNPEDIGLPVDDDLDFSEPPAGPQSQSIFIPRSSGAPEVSPPPLAGSPSLSSALSAPNFSDVPAAIALPPGDDLDLLDCSPEIKSARDIVQSISPGADRTDFLQTHSPRRTAEFVQNSGHDTGNDDPSHSMEDLNSNSFASEHLRQEAAALQSPRLGKSVSPTLKPVKPGMEESEPEDVEVNLPKQVDRQPLSTELARVQLFESGHIDPRNLEPKDFALVDESTGIPITENSNAIQSELMSPVAPKTEEETGYPRERSLPRIAQDTTNLIDVEGSQTGKAAVENSQISRYSPETSPQRYLDSQDQAKKSIEPAEVLETVPTILSNVPASQSLNAPENNDLQDSRISESIPEPDNAIEFALTSRGQLQEDPEFKTKSKKKSGSKRNRRDDTVDSVEAEFTPSKQDFTAVQSELPVIAATTTFSQRDELPEETPRDDLDTKITKKERKAKKGKRRDISPEPSSSLKHALGMITPEIASSPLDVVGDHEAGPSTHQEILDEAPTPALTKNDRKGKKTKYRDLSPDRAQSAEREDILDQTAPEIAVSTPDQKLLDEALGPALTKKDRKGKKTKYRDLSPERAQSIEREDVPDHTAPEITMSTFDQIPLDEAPGPAFTKKDKKGKKTKYREQSPERLQSLEIANLPEQLPLETPPPVANQIALDETTGPALTKKDRKGKKSKNRDLSPELGAQPLEPENISDQIAPETELPVLNQQSLEEEAPSPVLNKKDRKGKKAKYRDLSPDPAPQPSEPENISNQIAPETEFPVLNQQSLEEEAPRSILNKKYRKGKKAKYRDMSPDPAPKPSEPENISDQIAPENALPVFDQQSFEEAPSPVLNKKDRKGKKAKYRDLSPDPAPPTLEPEDISDQIVPGNALPVPNQQLLEEAPSPVMNKKDRKGKKAKYRDLSPDPAPPTLEPEDIPDQTALEDILIDPLQEIFDETANPALTKRGKKGKKTKYRDLSPDPAPPTLEPEGTPDQTAPEYILVDSHQEIVDETPSPALTKRGKKGKKTKYRDLSPDQVPQSRESEDISNQIALESVLPTIRSIDEDADLPKPDPKDSEVTIPVLDLKSQDFEVLLPQEQHFDETFIPISTKKRKKGKQGNILDLAEDPPASSRDTTDVPGFSTLESTVSDPALPREELSATGQDLKLDKQKEKGERFEKRDLSPDITVPSVESANVSEPMADQTELPPVSTSAEDIDLPLSRDEHLDETPIPELVKKDKRGKKSKKRDWLLDDTKLPQETANMLDPSIADIPDPNLSFSQAETTSSPLPPAEPSGRDKEQRSAGKIKKGKKSKRRDFSSEPSPPLPGAEASDERPTSQAIGEEKPKSLEELTPLNKSRSLEEPPILNEATSLEEPTVLNELSPSAKSTLSQEPTPLKELTSVKEPTHLEEVRPLEEPTPVEEVRPLEEPTPLEKPTNLIDSTNMEKSAALEEPTSVERPASLEEPTFVEKTTAWKEPAFVEKITAWKEPTVLEESTVLEEPTVLEESTASEDPMFIEKPMSSEDPTILEESMSSENLTFLKESKSMEAVQSRPWKESIPSEVSRSLQAKDFDGQAPLEESASLEKLKPSEGSITLEQSPPFEHSVFPDQSTSEKRVFVKESIHSEESAPLEEPVSLEKSIFSKESALSEDSMPYEDSKYADDSFPLDSMKSLEYPGTWGSTGLQESLSKQPILGESTPREDLKHLEEQVPSNVLEPLDFPGSLAPVGVREPLSSEELASLENKTLLEQPKSSEKLDFFEDHPFLNKSASMEASKPVEGFLPLESTFEEAMSSEEGRSVERRVPLKNSVKSSKSSPPEQSTFIETRTPFEEFKPTPSDTLFNRDSAIHVSDSPLLANKFSVYHAPRDSGYQDADASTFTNIKSTPMEGKDVFTQGETTHLGEDRFDEQNDSQYLRTPAPETTLGIPVEPGPDYASSVPAIASGFMNVNDEQYPTDDTLPVINPDAFPSPTDQPREPSPVDSTTKDRSSVLFQSSPSSRDVPVDQPSISQSPLHDHNIIDQARPDSWTLPPWSPTEEPTTDVEIGSGPAFPAPKIVETPSEKALEISLSPAGSLIDAYDDFRSPSRSPFTGSNAKQHRLDTITEYSPEESPLQRKHPALPATGSPEPKLRSRRVSLSSSASSRRQYAHPSSQTAVAEDFISTDDIISRLSWPSVDDESHTVDLERSRSRNHDKSLVGRASNTSTPSASVIKNREHDHRSLSGGSVGSVESITAIIRTPDQARPLSRLSQRSPGTPPLRRTDRSVSGDLRLANRLSSAKPPAKTIGAETDVEIGAGLKDIEAEGEGAVSTTITAPPPSIAIAVPSSSTYDPVKDKGKSRVIDMADVYEGWGDVRGASPMSPTRPPSMRRRQSMQVMELESKVDQLVSENRLLQDAQLKAQTGLDKAEQKQDSLTEAIRTRDRFLTQKDSELAELRQILEGLQIQVSRLTEVNQELIVTKTTLEQDHGQKYAELEAQHADTYEQHQQATREIDDLRQQHTQLSAAMEDIVRHEIGVAVEGKNVELRKLREELEGAKEQVRILQQQILASKRSDDLIVDRDVDYFDLQCQNICGRVQQWVLRFSKFSDGRACYLASEIREEKVVDRFENAMLDGSDVDSFLQDRVKRRDVFMSVVMTMVSEYIFTRYLFGLDREHRSKLKALEKTLAEAGPMKAVHKWRATTLMLLTKRDSFRSQRAQDTEAVALEIYETLAAFLPPPAHLVHQIQESLRNVMSSAVELSIEMRTQRAQYMMLPTLTPEYDTNGDLARKVYFNAALMNERSGATSSNEGLEAQQAVVRIVLFPLVVKKGDDSGIGDEEIVVCPAQVLTVPGAKDKDVARVQQTRMAHQSAISLGVSDIGMGGMI